MVRSLTDHQREVAEALEDAMSEFGEKVTFRRGDAIEVTIRNVVQGRTEWKGFGKGGAVVLSESVDFLTPVKGLSYAGVQLVPEEGDTFRSQR